MRNLTVAVAGACGALALAFIAPSGAQQLKSFPVGLCNASGDRVQAAFIVRTGANSWRAKGWFNFNNNECGKIGNFLEPLFLFYAEQSSENGKSWHADPDDKDTIWMCAPAKAFDIDANNPPNCPNEAYPFVIWPTSKGPPRLQ
jgi:uncharacterized membrane protein